MHKDLPPKGNRNRTKHTFRDRACSASLLAALLRLGRWLLHTRRSHHGLWVLGGQMGVKVSMESPVGIPVLCYAKIVVDMASIQAYLCACLA